MKENKQIKYLKIHLKETDWGLLTHNLSQRYGKIFAVLNMANADKPGGGYYTGDAAQEENMFRRTDCHFYINRVDDVQLSRAGVYIYTQAFTDLINGEGGRGVYIDTVYPRVCIRGPEIGPIQGGGYELLPDNQIFMFYELRAAAKDLRNTGRDQIDNLTETHGRIRIQAQLDTLKRNNVRNVILSAFGCGVFMNNPDIIARIYAEELYIRRGSFDVVGFAIYHAGYGTENYSHFLNAFEGSTLSQYMINEILELKFKPLYQVETSLLGRDQRTHITDRIYTYNIRFQEFSTPSLDDLKKYMIYLGDYKKQSTILWYKRSFFLVWDNNTDQFLLKYYTTTDNLNDVSTVNLEFKGSLPLANTRAQPRRGIRWKNGQHNDFTPTGENPQYITIYFDESSFSTETSSPRPYLELRNDGASELSPIVQIRNIFTHINNQEDALRMSSCSALN